MVGTDRSPIKSVLPAHLDAHNLRSRDFWTILRDAEQDSALVFLAYPKYMVKFKVGTEVLRYPNSLCLRRSSYRDAHHWPALTNELTVRRMCLPVDVSVK